MKEKVDKLTPEQEADLAVWRDKGLAAGLNTDRIDKEKAVDIIHRLQTVVLGRQETPAVFFENPLEAILAINLLAEDKYENPEQVRGKTKEEILKVTGKDKLTFYWPYLVGSFDSYWLYFYDYFIKHDLVEIEPELKEKLYILFDCLSLGLIYPLEDICFVTEKPAEIHLENGQLHYKTGPAISYNGDFKVYALNGVIVDQYLVETPEEELSMDYYNKQKNADVRTEFVRKFGIDRMMEFGKKIDSYENYNEEWWTKSEYELYDMNKLFEGVEYAPHLKMTNPTTKIFHVEPVAPTCKTISEALKDRFGDKEFQIQDIK